MAIASARHLPKLGFCRRLHLEHEVGRECFGSFDQRGARLRIGGIGEMRAVTCHTLDQNGMPLRGEFFDCFRGAGDTRFAGTAFGKDADFHECLLQKRMDGMKFARRRSTISGNDARVTSTDARMENLLVELGFLPSLPGISSHLHVDYGLMSLSLAEYAGLSAILELLMGALSDRYGRRPVILLSLALFTIGSIGCALSSNVCRSLRSGCSRQPLRPATRFQ